MPFFLISGMVVGIYFILEAIVNSGPLSDEHFYDRIDLQQPKIPSYRGLNPTVYSSLRLPTDMNPTQQFTFGLED